MPYFQHDGVSVDVLHDHKYSETFASRSIHEAQFRKINKLLIDKKIIDNNIIDSGAWIGDNAIPWAKIIDGIVYAIDPSIDNCEFIKKTAELNNLKNIKIITGALAERKKIISTDWDWYHCSFVNGDSGKNSIETTSIDILYDQNIINDIGYIHLDVEGMESEVLLGATNLIDNLKPIITFEQHLLTDKYKNLCLWLSEKLYTSFMINEILPGCREDCRNFIAIPTQKNPLEVFNLINSIIQTNLLVDL